MFCFDPSNSHGSLVWDYVCHQGAPWTMCNNSQWNHRNRSRIAKWNWFRFVRPRRTRSTCGTIPRSSFYCEWYFVGCLPSLIAKVAIYSSIPFYVSITVPFHPLSVCFLWPQPFMNSYWFIALKMCWKINVAPKMTLSPIHRRASVAPHTIWPVRCRTRAIYPLALWFRAAWTTIIRTKIWQKARSTLRKSNWVSRRRNRIQLKWLP